MPAYIESTVAILGIIAVVVVFLVGVGVFDIWDERRHQRRMQELDDERRLRDQRRASLKDLLLLDPTLEPWTMAKDPEFFGFEKIQEPEPDREPAPKVDTAKTTFL